MQIPKFSIWFSALALGTVLTLHAEDTPAQAKARAALEQKMKELEAQSPSAAAGQAVPTPAIPPDNQAQAKARAALLEKMNQLQPPPPAPAVVVNPTPPSRPAAPSTKPVVAKPAARVVADYPGKDLGLNPIKAPPLPISATKEEKLQALLLKYKADQITPEEYYKERAAILAAP